jgi:hypothetical protein
MSSSVDCPVYVQGKTIQKIHAKECLLFPDAWKKYFELQPELKKVTHAQAAASGPPTSGISTRPDSVILVSETDGLKVCPYLPQALPK